MKLRVNKNKTFIILSWVIPLAIILFILYMNFLPFGFSETRTIQVGSETDTTPGVFYLEQSSALGARQEFQGQTFRAIDGVVNVIYQPDQILRNVMVSAELKGEGVYFIEQPDITNVSWDYDFMNELDKFQVQVSPPTSNSTAPLSLYDQFIQKKEINIGDISETPFAIKITYNSTMKNNLLSGDIGLIQDSKQIVLNYTSGLNGTDSSVSQKKIVYNLPDFFIGNEQKIVIGYDGSEVYLFVNETLVGEEMANETSFENIQSSDGTVKVYGNDVSPSILNGSIQKDENGCLIFDGNTRLVLPNSSNDFENGPFSVYVEWTPTLANNSQELIGHYNWEIWQNEKTVHFMIGRTYNQGPMYSIHYLVNPNFFNRPHSLLAVYNPSSQKSEAGYIELYVDGNFAGRKEFGDETIWIDYGNRDLSLGKSMHGIAIDYMGSICNARLAYAPLISENDYAGFSVNLNVGEVIKMPIFGHGNLEKVSINVVKN